MPILTEKLSPFPRRSSVRVLGDKFAYVKGGEAGSGGVVLVGNRRTE